MVPTLCCHSSHRGHRSHRAHTSHAPYTVNTTHNNNRHTTHTMATGFTWYALNDKPDARGAERSKHDAPALDCHMGHVFEKHVFVSIPILQESGTGDVGTCVADKGFSSPRVLILCPFRSICHDLVKMILSICPAAKQVMNQKRFREEFSPGVVDDAEGSDKPADWLHVFGGNRCVVLPSAAFV